MKSILLTTSALVAFAGAAAADGHTSVKFSGEASAEVNDVTGYATDADITATMAAKLDNGLRATAVINFNPSTGATNEVSVGSIKLAGKDASVTFGTGLDGAVFSTVGDDYDIGQAAEESTDGIVGAFTVAGASVAVSMPVAAGADIDTDTVEIGVSTDLSGWAVALGLVGGEYAATAAGTVAGADLNFGMASNDEWDAGVSYGLGAVTLSASTDEAEAWTVGADYAAGDYTAGVEYNADESWEVSAGYAAGAIAVAASLDSADVTTLGATYDLGNGMTAGAGVAGDDSFAYVDYDLGGGASAFASYTDAAAKLVKAGPAERDVTAGTTVGVSFGF